MQMQQKLNMRLTVILVPEFARILKKEIIKTLNTHYGMCIDSQHKLHDTKVIIMLMYCDDNAIKNIK